MNKIDLFDEFCILQTPILDWNAFYVNANDWINKLEQNFFPRLMKPDQTNSQRRLEIRRYCEQGITQIPINLQESEWRGTDTEPKDD